MNAFDRMAKRADGRLKGAWSKSMALVLTFFLALVLAPGGLTPGETARAAEAGSIVLLETGQEYSGVYDPGELTSYRFSLEENAVVILRGIRDERFSYFLSLYYEGSSQNLNRLALSQATQTGYDGAPEVKDIQDGQMRVTSSARQDTDAFFTLSQGDYYLQVAPYSASDKVNYAFSLDVQPFVYASDQEPNGEMAAAADYKTGSWQEGHIIWNGMNPDAGKQDWYLVTVPEAGSYRFDYASDGFFRGSFTWYDSQGKHLDLGAANNAATVPGRTVLEAMEAPHCGSLGEHGDAAEQYQDTLEFPRAGDFYLCVTAADAGSYKYCLSPVAPSLSPDPDSANEASVYESSADADSSDINSSSDSGSNRRVELIFLLGQAFYNSNGSVITMDTAPYSSNNRVFLPIRALASGIGIGESGIIWNSVDRTVTLTDGTTTLSMVLDSPVLYVNGNPQQMDVSPAYSANRVFLPARYIVEAFGLTAEWEPLTGSVMIRGEKTGSALAVPASTDDASSSPESSQPSVGTIELDRQMIGDELRKGSYNGSLVNGQPSGNGTWVDCLGRIKTGNFSMSSSTDISISSAHIAFPDGAEFTGIYSAVLYTAIEKFEGHFVFPNNGNAFDGIVENTADLQQHMVGTYTLPNGNTVDVDRYYDLSGGN